MTDNLMDREELITRFGRLYTPVVCDVLDQMGYRHQFMDYTIHPLAGVGKVSGFAFTMQAMASPVQPDLPYQKQFEGTDSLTEGDVLVVSGAGTHSAFWGELFSTRAQSRGCRGAIIDGLCRDSQKIMAMGFSVFCRGTSPSDSFGRALVTDFSVPVECAGVRVFPGDFIMADVDGVVVVPASVLAEVIERAEAKALTEDKVREALQHGSSVQEVYKKYGVM